MIAIGDVFSLGGGHSPRNDFDRRRTGPAADHRVEIRASFILFPVRVIDQIVDRPVDRFERDFLRHAGNRDPPCLLPDGGLVPAGVLSVVGTHIKGIANDNRPNPCWRSICFAIFTERRNMKIIGISDFAQFLFRPCSHCFSPLFYPLTCGIAHQSLSPAIRLLCRPQLLSRQYGSSRSSAPHHANV